MHINKHMVVKLKLEQSLKFTRMATYCYVEVGCGDKNKIKEEGKNYKLQKGVSNQ
jgi:hypothetical protein